jgi:hypothetical protein
MPKRIKMKQRNGQGKTCFTENSKAGRITNRGFEVMGEPDKFSTPSKLLQEGFYEEVQPAAG